VIVPATVLVDVSMIVMVPSDVFEIHTSAPAGLGVT